MPEKVILSAAKDLLRSHGLDDVALSIACARVIYGAAVVFAEMASQ
jgi:hypothetical protein